MITLQALQPSPMAQAMAANYRNRRFPIPAALSSDKDVSGGVSLTAVSNPDDNTQVSARPCANDTMDYKPPTPPVRVPSTLKANAKPFVPLPEPTESVKPVEPARVDNPVSQPATSQTVKSTTTTNPEVYTTDHLVKLYHQQRSRGTTTNAQGQPTHDYTHGRHENGGSTTRLATQSATHSTAIINSAQSHAATAPTYLNNQHQQQPRNGNEHFVQRRQAGASVPGQAPQATISAGMYHQGSQFRPPMATTPSYGILPLPQKSPERHDDDAAPRVQYNTAGSYQRYDQDYHTNAPKANGYVEPTYGKQAVANCGGNNRQHHDQGLREEKSNLSINGDYRGATAHNTPSEPVYYRAGLPGSASDGTMMKYHKGNSNPTTAMVRYDDRVSQVGMARPIEIGPMDFPRPPKEVQNIRSEVLQALTEHGRPSLKDLFGPQFLPFTESYKFSSPSDNNGVVAIKNIPFGTSRTEVIALLGRNSKILNDSLEPVHIIMCRVTSKTQDAYCELTSLEAAIELVERFKKSAESGRVGRLGNRTVEVELSSQTNLMKALFPVAHGVNWINARPSVQTTHKYPWENFKCFFTEEEMVMLSKHVENSQRSSYAKICPERPYECMISTLRKIPWYMSEHITIKQRHSVYEACLKMISTLAAKLKRAGDRDYDRGRNGEPDPEAERLTPQLQHRLVKSAMLCAGFTVVQKDNIATIAGLSEQDRRQFNQPRFADSWRHQWTLIPKTGLPLDVLEWYICVIREETNRVVDSLDISQRRPLQSMAANIDGYWGYFWAEVNYPEGPAFDNMTLAECSKLEWQAIERIINRAIEGGNMPASYTARVANGTALASNYGY
ncbi:hypothetical protein F5Y19DRAFT_477934 [Xylariaceae sp. FL1651]|nr:hypothetical protein F5Y19DRAFT_477934 [Xylariaceae sp. FL1651]